MLTSLKKDRSIRAQILPWSLSGKAKTSHLEKRLFSAKACKTSFFKPIDLKLFQEGKKRVQASCSAAARVSPHVMRAPLGGAGSH